MNVASLELCKELYELSGWGYRYHHPKEGQHDLTDKQWYWFEGKTTRSYWEAIKTDYNDRDPYDGRRPTATTHRMGLVAPAYDSGYLLRKAGSGAGVIKNSKTYTARRPNMFGAPENKDPLNGRIGWEAGTPEDALCLMLIELIKQGLIPGLEKQNNG